MTQNQWKIRISRKNFGDIQIDDALSPPELGDNQVEFALQTCALTANNVTYALLGKSFGPWCKNYGYWDFFSSDDGDGILPVWGFAKASRSKHADIQAGQLVYGYFPLRSHWIATPDKISARGFIEREGVRAQLPSVYNQYTYTEALEGYDPEHASAWPLYRPLLITAFMIADQFSDNDHYGAKSVIVASASSKTACTFASCLKMDASAPGLIGLTSAANREFVNATGLYDHVFTYDEIQQLPTDMPVAFVDMAGSGTITSAVHHQLGEQLRYSLMVGKSHWDQELAMTHIPGPKVEMFFAPSRVEMRMRDWGAETFNSKMDKAWQTFLTDSAERFEIGIYRQVNDAVSKFKQLLAGTQRSGESVLLDFRE